MAHIAAAAHAVLKTPSHSGAPQVAHEASETDDGDFAAVLASLTPKTEAPEAKPHAAEPHHAAHREKKVEAPKPAVKIAARAVAPKHEVAAKAPAPVKTSVAKTPDIEVAEDDEDEHGDAPVVVALRPAPALTTKPEVKVAPAPDPAPVLKVVPREKPAPVVEAPKVPQQAIEKLVAEAKIQPMPVEAPKPAPQKPAATAKLDAKTQAVLAKAQINVVDIDEPAPPVVKTSDTPPQPPSTDDAKPAPQPAEAAPSPRQQQPQAQAQPQAPAAPAVAQVQAPAAPQVAPAPETPQTQQQQPQPNIGVVAAQIAAKAGQGAKLFEIRLDPPELGRVEVHLAVAHDGKAEATLYADRPETVALLQRDSQNLERALKDAGLELSNSSLNFSLKGEQRQGDGGGASTAHTRSLSNAVVARSEAVNASLASQHSAPADGRLDIRV
ncbi:MAG TPA: flagellar hook-length control protein FliK [Rhizomicrobium sp.]|nr:flagellar hook-length control protein FliK [Rhizomicrobium sp.]